MTKEQGNALARKRARLMKGIKNPGAEIEAKLAKTIKPKQNNANTGKMDLMKSPKK